MKCKSNHKAMKANWSNPFCSDCGERLDSPKPNNCDNPELCIPYGENFTPCNICPCKDSCPACLGEWWRYGKEAAKWEDHVCPTCKINNQPKERE